MLSGLEPTIRGLKMLEVKLRPDPTDTATRERTRNSSVLRLNRCDKQKATLLVDQFVSNPLRAEDSNVVVHFQDLLKRDCERA